MAGATQTDSKHLRCNKPPNTAYSRPPKLRNLGVKADHGHLGRWRRLTPRALVRFWSADIESDVKALLDKGLVFDELDMGTIKTVNHIATVPGIGKPAWFKDPDGNTLALFQPESLITLGVMQAASLPCHASVTS